MHQTSTIDSLTHSRMNKIASLLNTKHQFPLAKQVKDNIRLLQIFHRTLSEHEII